MQATGPIPFVIDGPLDQHTGGYLYDRIVIDGLRARGAFVEVESLAVPFGRAAGGGAIAGARASARENLRFARLVARLPAGATLIVDELCHPRVALAAILERVRPRLHLITVVHHLAASERHGLAASARLPLERLLLDASARLITTSTTTRDLLRAHGLPSARLTVIRPGRDRLGVRAAPPLPCPSGRLRLLFVGAITPRKGVLDLVRAFPAVAGRATLTLAGPIDRDPGYVAEVLAAIARGPAGIRITGSLDDTALEGELDRHDVFVFPSRYEGFGIVLAEAVSHGLAVITTRVGAIPEVVRDGEEAILIAPGDTRALAAAMLRLVEDRGKVTAMQERAIARSLTLPRWEDTQRAFAETVLGPPGSA